MLATEGNEWEVQLKKYHSLTQWISLIIDSGEQFQQSIMFSKPGYVSDECWLCYSLVNNVLRGNGIEGCSSTSGKILPTSIFHNIGLCPPWNFFQSALSTSAIRAVLTQSQKFNFLHCLAILQSFQMGILFSSLWSKLFSKAEVKIIIVGLDNAGKTTILYKL